MRGLAGGQRRLVAAARGQRLADEVAAHQQGVDRHVGQRAQRLRLGSVKPPRLTVDHAQRANALAARQNQRRPSVEANLWLACDQRVVGKARVERSVGHLEQGIALDGVGAEGFFARALGDFGQAHIDRKSTRLNSSHG